MDFNNRLELIQNQRLVMTTQIKQSLSILNMSKTELEEEIKKESEENPLIEIEKEGEINWEEYVKDIEKSSFEKSFMPNFIAKDDINFENMIRDNTNLYEDLKFQVSMYNISCFEKKICEYIIDSLDENGYLTSTKNEIIDQLKINEEDFNNALYKVQQLYPSGVGARNLSECLIIQMNDKNINDNILREIAKNDLNLIADNKYKVLSKKYHISMQKCVELIDILKSLNPKPGKIKCKDKVLYIQPDVIVEKIDGEYIVRTNENDSYKIKINNYYKEILKNSNSDESAKSFIKEKLNSASNLVKNIENRKSTILKIAEEILRAQSKFLENGSKFIKPLKMKDIAETLGFHESTISRGVNGKYMLTPYGLYEFKYFFSSSIESSDGSEQISSTIIKKLIQEIIKNEDKKKPISDENISKILKNKGINIARRTVTKYREEQKIASSSKRRQY